MQLLLMPFKFGYCFIYYLAWGEFRITRALKIGVIVLWLLLLYYRLKPEDKLVFGREESPPMANLEIQTWVQLLFGAACVLAALGAACVRYRSVIFKVAKEMELSGDRYRLRVDRRGWMIDVEAPHAEVRRFVDLSGTNAFAHPPFALTWSHQPKVGELPKFRGRGPMYIDVFHDDRTNGELKFCGFNGNEMRADAVIHFSTARKLWAEIAVAYFVRWFSVTPSPPIGFTIVLDIPPFLRRPSLLKRLRCAWDGFRNAAP